MAKPGGNHEKELANMVHQDAILCETILKEHKHQKIYRNYSINPYKKTHILTGKPNSFHDTEEGEEDENFKSVIERANLEPGKRYLFPQTESQEIGWITKPLLNADRSDRRLHFARQNSALTKYMDAAWRVKEQQQNMN
ncbi:hypothetical protein CAPTEDRAFT_133751 [Capitella teleta]|uniref:Family with sequence similarity 183 member A n=1 Tax=Capitella teleta TaxID=283909 RepID=R7TMV0_CAPTE|nr:hypothetical protein CAPTEDRAFT_133751 [Capitella teleta]|eukprot:ELT94832.1 hypothetical protein CAPTEDRAFT_133751 [Capitella teleta]